MQTSKRDSGLRPLAPERCRERAWLEDPQCERSWTWGGGGGGRVLPEHLRHRPRPWELEHPVGHHEKEAGATAGLRSGVPGGFGRTGHLINSRLATPEELEPRN